MALALAEIEFRALKRFFVGWYRELLSRLFARDGGKLAEKVEAPFPHGLVQLFVEIVEIKKWRRGRELLSLKKQRRPWSEQQ